MKPWQAKTIAEAVKEAAAWRPLREDDYIFRNARPDDDTEPKIEVTLPRRRRCRKRIM